MTWMDFELNFVFCWSESSAHRIFRHDSRLDILEQIIGTAGFAANTRELVASEGVSFNECASAPSIDVEVAAFKFQFQSLDMRGTSRIKSTRECKLCGVGDLNCFIKIFCF